MTWQIQLKGAFVANKQVFVGIMFNKLSICYSGTQIETFALKNINQFKELSKLLQEADKKISFIRTYKNLCIDVYCLLDPKNKTTNYFVASNAHRRSKIQFQIF